MVSFNQPAARNEAAFTFQNESVKAKGYFCKFDFVLFDIGTKKIVAFID